ncbi:MAG: PVC-type heme-binding CxxCH protein [Limisphaerales bacterium]
MCTELLSGAPKKQLTGVYAPAASAALPPAESQKAFTVPPGFEVRLFASEPDVINPVAMTWDERGRLWVVELFEYPLGAPKGAKPRDRIKILEDTDGDGLADKVTIFADGLNLATGIALGNGGVYVGQAPDLLFLRDTNHDDHADTREVLLTGFDTNDRHELLNGFTWGPDGWLYMTHGVFNHSKVKIPEASSPGVEVSAALCRYHPRTKKFEAFADGTSNPWGVDFDAAGNAFVSACVIDHLFHLAPGGIYQRQGGVPENPYSYELLPSIVDHKHYMAAYSGICIYQGDMFPPEYQGHVFMGNIHQCAINHDLLIPNGSSFKAVAEKDFLTTTDGWFRPVSEQVGPDGAMWIADWYDKYPCYQNAQADPDGVDRTYGRIWRVVYTNAEPREKWPTGKGTSGDMVFDFDLSKLSNNDLKKYLGHPNIWQRRMAQRILAENADKHLAMTDSYGLTITGGSHAELLDLFEHGNTADARFAAFLALHEIGSVGRYDARMQRMESWADFVAKALDDRDPRMRAWSCRFAAELLNSSHFVITHNQPSQQTDAAKAYAESIVDRFEVLASDSNASVRVAVATAIRQTISGALTVDTTIQTDEKTRTFAGKVLVKLIESSADAKDPLIPYMIWMASEPLFAKNPAGGLKWLAENGARTMPLSGILTRKGMRRICDTGDTNKLDQAVEFLLKISDDRSGLAADALDGLIEAQKAKALIPGRDVKWLFATLRDNPDVNVRTRASELGSLWNDPDSIAATLKAINDQSAPIEARIKAIEVSKEKKTSGAREALLEAIGGKNPEPIVIEALRAISAVGGDDVPAQILKHWASFGPNARRAAADTMVSRQQWATDFLNAVENKTIAPNEISAGVFRSLANYKDPKIDERAKSLFGRFRESSADKLKIIKQKRHMVLLEEPDIARGHEVAKKTCFVCHKLYGEGADVGPDLTGVGRSSLDALLANVIDPNQVVGKGYENVEVETKDGRNVSGRLVENDAAHIKLLSAGPKEEVVSKSDIESMRVSQLSVMPEGLEQMVDKDFRDLIWYILNPPGDNRPLTAELKNQLTTQK